MRFTPQLVIFDFTNARKPRTDLDIVALVRGGLYIGECKHNSECFFDDNRKCLDNLLMIAEIVRPDVIILACTVDWKNKLAKAAKYIRHKLKDVVDPPKLEEHVADEPEYFPSEGFNYVHL